MAMGRREKDIKLLVEKFIKLVESLNPGERLSIKKVSGNGGASRKAAAKAPKVKAAREKKSKVKSRG